MIDFHTHILSKMDDGAKDDSVSVDVLLQEKAQGVKKIVFTPHYYGMRSVESFFLSRKEAMARLLPQIPQGIETRLGAEVHITGVNDPPHETLCSLAIEGTKCVMFEFPFLSAWSNTLVDKVADLVQETGYKPVIAHAERYAEILKDPALLSEFADMGCYVQLTTGAFLDKTMRNFAFAALRQGLVHCLGTDAHDAERRAPKYQAAKETVYDAGYGEEWDRTQEIMRRLLAGETPKLPFGNVRKVFGFYR